jgi:hypothetical protein
VLRRSVFLLPIVLVLSALPVARGPQPLRIRQWSMVARSTATLRAPGSFGLVGVAWPATSRAPREVLIRTGRTGARWTKWSALEPAEPAADRGTEGTGVGSTDLLWVGDARFVQVRFVGGRPVKASLSFVDPGPDPTVPASSALAAVSQPGIISRAAWGADESIRRAKPEYAEPVRAAIIHHTATTDSYSKSESARIVRAIYAYHVKTNGWNDIGYNFLVDKYGQTFEGRYGGITRAVVGAQAEGFNRHTTGVSLIGTFSRSRPPAAAMDALKRIVAWKLDRDSVDPKSTTTFVSGGSRKWPAGQSVRLNVISGHKDVQSTSCPGVPIYDALPGLRSAVASYGLPKLYSPKLTSSVITPNGDGVADAIRATGRFSGTMSWKVQVLDYASHVLQSTTGTGTSFNVRSAGKTSAGALLPQDTYRYKITGHNTQGSVRTNYLSFGLWRYPNGTYFLPKPSGRSYILNGGKLRHPAVSLARATRYRSQEVIPVSDVLTKVYPVGSQIGFRDGSIVRVDGNLYLISDGYRRPISATTMTAMGYDSSAVIDTTSAGVAPHPLGATVDAAGGYPDGTALRSSTGSMAWVLAHVARPVTTANVRSSWLIRAVDLAGPADSDVATGAGSKPIGFRDGSLVQVSGEGTIYVVADGRRRPISSRSFAKMGYNPANIRPITPAELVLNPQGDPL